MQNLGTAFGQSPNTLILALLFGMIPSILWLFFWLREDDKNKEPRGLLLMTFITGMLAVIVVLPIQKLISIIFADTLTRTILWSTTEEIFKYLVFAVIVLRSPFLDEPVDFPIYLMTAALGFAALENTFFLLQPLAANETIVSFLTGNLRYLGATLLHSVASGFVGIVMGLVYYKRQETRRIYLLLGLLGAICLHTVFNFFIIDRSGENFFQIFGFLWVTAIIIMLLFEKLRRMGKYARKTEATISI